MNKPRMFSDSKIIVKYQILDQDGNYILDPFFELRAAEFMIQEFYLGCDIIEVECNG